MGCEKKEQVWLAAEAEANLFVKVLDEEGEPVLDGEGDPTLTAVWSGCCLNGLRVERRWEELRLAGSGDSHESIYQLNEEWLIHVERLWLAEKFLDGADDVWKTRTFTPARNAEYVLQINFHDLQGPHYFSLQWLFDGVTVLGLPIGSKGVREFVENQQFRAKTREEKPQC